MNNKFEKAIAFDSGAIINFAMNGYLELLADLKKRFNGKFLITEEIIEEIINRPLKIRRFELEALRIKKLFDDNVLELPYNIIDKKILKKKTDEIFNILNHAYFARGDFMNIVSRGEVSILALSLLLKEKGINNATAIDERTARLLCEKPSNLQQIFSNKLHTKVEMKKDLSFLNKIKVIRSSELMYIANKKGLVKLKNHVLEALLYAVKFKGCSISFEEINEMKRL